MNPEETTTTYRVTVPDFDMALLVEAVVGPKEGADALIEWNSTDGDGWFVELTSDGLDVLAAMDSRDDGYYDGDVVWIYGEPYAVTSSDGKPFRCTCDRVEIVPDAGVSALSRACSVLGERNPRCPQHSRAAAPDAGQVRAMRLPIEPSDAGRVVDVDQARTLAVWEDEGRNIAAAGCPVCREECGS